MAAYLTASATMMCPHGGTVVAIPANPSVTLGGSPILQATDTFLVAGCPFNLVAPHPCVRVQWIVTARKATMKRLAPLTLDSVGLCIAPDGAPQGPVMIMSTQPKAGGW
jgi:hypothetical protein